MRGVVRNLVIPAPYVFEASKTVADAHRTCSELIAGVLTKSPTANVCISCGARRQANGEMPCEH